MKKTLLLLFAVILLAACSNRRQSAVVLSVADGQVKATGISDVDLQGMKRDTMPASAWVSLFPVYAMPADTDMKNYQRPVSGKYRLTDNAVTFTPDTPFIKGKTYFARYYFYNKPISTWDLVFRRRKIGRAPYAELIFKY